MARTSPTKKAWRALAWLLGLTLGLTALLGAGVAFWGASWAPRLALDLEGGTQIILGAQLEGGQTPTTEQLNQAVSIIRDRIDAAGVAESEVTTQGDRNVVVAIPGEPDEQTLARIQASAKLEFRAVLFTDLASNVVSPTASPTPDATDEATDEPAEGDEAAGDTAAEPEAEATPEPTATPQPEPTNGSDLNWITPELSEEFGAFSCDTLEQSGAHIAPAAEPLITCDVTGTFKYILGPVEVSGETISDASSGLVTNQQGISTGQWGVFIVFNEEGTRQFAEVTTRLFGFPETDVRNQFAIVLDGRIISAPTTQAVITDGKPQITGTFTQETAKVLADQLKFGALPIGFEIQSNEVISATLGTTQLQSGLIAGLIGLILVVGYSIFQYRTLASVTIASLVIAGVLTYLVIAILAWRQGYRLSLAGVAGLIVAIGLTVDSFIIYFERIRDELRDGRTLVGAVEAGWKRALRTIYAAKVINFISAVVLFVLAVGNVKGFALTLGITVIIDVIVVVLFTHPVMQLLATTKFFASGHPASGLDPNALGAVYRGRAQFRKPTAASKGASREAARRQTIAERRAAELDSAGTRGKDD